MIRDKWRTDRSVGLTEVDRAFVTTDCMSSLSDWRRCFADGVI